MPKWKIDYHQKLLLCAVTLFFCIVPYKCVATMPFDTLFPSSCYQETVELCMQLLSETKTVQSGEDQALFAGHILRICHLVNIILDESQKNRCNQYNLGYLIDLMNHVQRECIDTFNAFPIAHTIFAGMLAQLQAAEENTAILMQ